MSSSNIYLKTFDVIKDFVDDLKHIFHPDDDAKKQVVPFLLYYTLIHRISPEEDTRAIDRILNGFRTFFKEYLPDLRELNTQRISDDQTVIRYQDHQSILIPLHQFLDKSENTNYIIEHLLTISAYLEPQDETFNAIEKLQSSKKEEDQTNVSSIRERIAKNIDMNTPEGKFISDITERTEKTLAGQTFSNPMEGIMKMMQSGILTDMMSGVNSQGTDPRRMKNCLKGMIDAFMPDEEETPKVEEAD